MQQEAVKRSFLSNIMSYNHDVKRQIPSLAALQAFESAARHLSFTRAAEELNLTQSAISRNIRLIEDRLRIRLFRRSKQRIALTKAGEIYVVEVRSALARIEASTLHILSYRSGAGTLNLATLPTFGTKWLCRDSQASRTSIPASL